MTAAAVEIPFAERDVVVRGAASPEELAAVLTALHAVGSSAETPSGYERWRRTRLAALRAGVRR